MSLSENFHDRPPIGSLIDFVHGVTEENPLHLELAIEDTGRLIIFHDKKFKHNIQLCEYNLTTSKLDFVVEGKEKRDIGIPLNPSVAKHMHNAHQVFMVQMNPNTGDATEGRYVPLILLSS